MASFPPPQPALPDPPSDQERARQGARGQGARGPGAASTAPGSRTPTSSAIAQEEFDGVLGERPNQLERRRPEASVTAADLLSVPDTPGDITEAGIPAERLGRHPVPRLVAARDREIGGGDVLHQVVDRGRAGPVEPRGEVLDPDRDVLPDAGLGDLARRVRHGEQIAAAHVHVGPPPVELVRPRRRAPASNLARDRRPGRGGRPRCRRSRRRPRAPCPRAPWRAPSRSPRGRAGWG